ncbi:hypothetical protein A3860_38725 [Niastella vici]|uniref:Uncharacterized protein n=1 Tax=Niastella vici TaxID=1703345 RepID=A0A1V9FLG9_9BACT|nr:hypothetical protein A3860_38725 [Niastella vici]
MFYKIPQAQFLPAGGLHRYRYFKISTKSFTVLPDHIFAAITDLVNNAQLGYSNRENAFNGVCK